MYCSQCGFNIEDKVSFCPACGMKQQYAVQNNSVVPNTGQAINNHDADINTYFNNAKEIKDGGGSLLWGLLCFVIPIVGIILYYRWREKYPGRAKVCLWCGIISMIFNVILYPYVESSLTFE